MRKKEIRKTVSFVKRALAKAEPGHDFWHVWRVWQNAKYISKKEGANMFIVELAALLHDVADPKTHQQSETYGLNLVTEWLRQINVENEIIKEVSAIIKNMSFRKSFSKKTQPLSKEGKVVQDADRLDAMGAMGIARTFIYSGIAGRVMHNPRLKPKRYKSIAQYKNGNYSAINHFYEKLLLLKDLMNTKTAKKMAVRRHKFMEKYLVEFFREWNK